MDDDELTRLAEEELLREAKRGEAREAVHGVMGWLRDKTPRTNKRFLSNTLSNALQHNHRQRIVGSIREKNSIHQNKEKLKQKERTHPYSSVRETDEKKTKQCRKHKSSDSRNNQDSGGEDSLSDEESRGYHNPRRKHQKLLK